LTTVGYPVTPATSAYADPVQYCSRHDAGNRTPPLSSKKYTSAERRFCADGHVSSTHCSPVFGQVPQRRLTVSFDVGGSMPSFTAATASHADV
jgi:hypothetical protein